LIQLFHCYAGPLLTKRLRIPVAASWYFVVYKLQTRFRFRPGFYFGSMKRESNNMNGAGNRQEQVTKY